MIAKNCVGCNINGKHIGQLFKPTQYPLPAMIEVLLRVDIVTTEKCTP
jgi:hypothetical protein